MISGLSRFVTNVVLANFNTMLTGYTSEGGNLVVGSLAGAYEFEPVGILPEIWVECDFPSELTTMFIGNTMGSFDTEQTVLAENLRCPFGVRTQLAPERDDIFDFLVSTLLVGMNNNVSPPATWISYFWTQSAIQVKGVSEITYAPSKTTRFGQIYEARGVLNLDTQVSSSQVFPTVEGISILPQTTVEIVIP